MNEPGVRPVVLQTRCSAPQGSKWLVFVDEGNHAAENILDRKQRQSRSFEAQVSQEAASAYLTNCPWPVHARFSLAAVVTAPQLSEP